MKGSIILFLKGFLMGTCDVIPGVSGGTIAFITGIYSRLINAVKNISPKLISDFFRDKKKFKEDVKNLDLVFLITLGLGIITAVFIGARVITFLLERYFVYTISFFIGLILISSKIIYNNIKNHHLKNISFGIIGLLVGILLAILIPMEINPTLLYVFFGGFVAISAMFLPGISGAFLLLILGLYEFMLNVIRNIWENISFFIVFILGAILGMFTISRVISFLFKKDRCKTLYFLLGLVIGCLSIPIKKIYLSDTVWSAVTITLMVASFLLGIFSVKIVGVFEKRKRLIS